MHGTSKSLQQMNARERVELMSAVADALEAAADEAQEEGDSRSAANSFSLACSLRGWSGGLEARDLRAAELLLEQGIVLVHLLANRNREPATLH